MAKHNVIKINTPDLQFAGILEYWVKGNKPIGRLDKIER